MRFIPLLLALGLAACAPAFPEPRPAREPVFDPIAFFTGPSEGRASLRIALRGPAAVAVHSLGRVEGDGSLVLDQRIERAGHDPQQRSWRIRRTGPGTYAATLSSAEGPVAVAVDGNLLRLDFREKGAAIHQDLLLAADGASAINHMTLSKLGLRVATLEERIEKRPPG